MVQSSRSEKTKRVSYTVNQAIGQSLGLGWLPPNQIFYWGLMAVPTLGASVITPLSFGQVFPVWFIGCVTFWALTGEKEYRFLNQFRALPYFQTNWVRGRAVVKWEMQSLLPKKPRHGSQTMRGFKSLGKLTPIEDFSDLVCYGQMELQGLEVGFYLLEDRKKQLQFVFRWFVEGPHAEISEREAQIILEKWNTGLQELLPGETVTFEQESFAEDKLAQAFLDQQLRLTDNALLKALTVSQKVRLRQLRDQGQRQVQRTLVTATYTPEVLSHEKQDLIAKAILWLSRAWENFQGQREQLDYERLQKLVGFAFQEGFLRWHSLFTSLMGLEARPLTSGELWERDYAEFHQGNAPPLPQQLILNDKGLQMEADDPYLHTATVLFQGEQGASTVPVNHPEWVYLPAHRQYVGLMQLGRPKDYGSARQKLRYLWQALSSQHTGDCRVVIQVSAGNRSWRQFDLERLTRNATSISTEAIAKQDVAVGAERRAQDAIRAQEALQEGDTVVQIAAGLLLYRKNPQTLERDFARLHESFYDSDTYREPNIMPRLWLQTLPYVKEAFLQQPTERRDVYLSRDATGMLPLTAIHSPDAQGVELIALESGTPLHLDAFSPDRHLRLAIFGQPRSGKSLFQSEWIVQACLQRAPVVGFDFPRPNDGSSTYKDLTEHLAGAGFNACYYDILSKSNNLLDLPDYTGMKQAQERRQQVIQFQIEATVTIAIREVNDPLLEQDVRALVTQSLSDFHALPEIQARYQAANAAGMGTSEWENIPTYHDYCGFLETWLKDHFAQDAELASDGQRTAASLLLEQLRACLKGKLSRAIAAPSSFPPETDTLILALTNLNSNYEAAVMALVGYAALLRRALGSETSFFITDESPILFKFPAISKRIGQLCANGGKWGVRVILSGQDAGTIYHSAAGQQIFDTLNAVMVGSIARNAKKSFIEALALDGERLDYCTSKHFYPSARELRSHWLLYRHGDYTPCAYYPSELLLSLTANNPDETAARERVMQAYADPIAGAIAFMNLYREARRAGKPMSDITPEPRRLNPIN